MIVRCDAMDASHALIEPMIHDSEMRCNLCITVHAIASRTIAEAIKTPPELHAARNSQHMPRCPAHPANRADGGSLRHHHLHELFVVDLTVAIDICFADHFVDLLIPH